MRYAAYGSNLHPLRLRERTPSASLLGTASLAGVALAFSKRGQDGSGKCTLAPDAGSRVWVAVYEIAEADEPLLDRFEGLGKGYTLETIELERFGACRAYVAQAEHIDEALAPYTWYRDLVLAGCCHHRFPDDYVARIGAVAARPDPDRGRHELHMNLVRRALETDRRLV